MTGKSWCHLSTWHSRVRNADRPKEVRQISCEYTVRKVLWTQIDAACGNLCGCCIGSFWMWRALSILLQFRDGSAHWPGAVQGHNFLCHGLDHSAFWGPSQYEKCRLTSIGIPVLKIRRSRDRLIFKMGIPIPGKDGLYIETGRRSQWHEKTRKEQNIAFFSCGKTSTWLSWFST